MAYNIFDKYFNQTRLNEQFEVNPDWALIRSKQVVDMDGFTTEYSWYTDGDKHLFMFGDSDLYAPSEDYADHIAYSDAEAEDWFNNYAEDSDDDYEYLDESSSLYPSTNFVNDAFDSIYGIVDDNDLATLEESINQILEKMSDEDAHDSEILRAIIQKTANRTNARLTPEEKEILAKYNLYRDNRKVLIRDIPYTGRSDADISNIRGGNKPERNYYRNRYRSLSSDNVNYADIARKRGARERARFDAYDNDLLTKFTKDRRELSSAIWSRDYNQRVVDNADAVYRRRLAAAQKAYEDALTQAERERNSADTYYKDNLDRAQAKIDKLLRKD